MELVDIESMQTRLNEQFIPLEPMLTGMRLIPISTSNAGLNDCQQSLNVTFPPSFSEIVNRFDFGHFTIGPVAFCNRGDYFSWLTEMNNSANDHPWWGHGQRIRGIVMIANSDRFAILLDTRSEEILALEHGSGISSGAFKVADSFDLFIQGLGTAFFERLPNGGNENLAKGIAATVCGNPVHPFWQWIVA